MTHSGRRIREDVSKHLFGQGYAFTVSQKHVLTVDTELESFLFIVVCSVLKNTFQPGDGGEYPDPSARVTEADRSL